MFKRHIFQSVLICLIPVQICLASESKSIDSSGIDFHVEQTKIAKRAEWKSERYDYRKRDNQADNESRSLNKIKKNHPNFRKGFRFKH